MRNRPVLTALLAALLLLQWGTAFAQCLRLAPPQTGLTIEICTTDGIRHLAMPLDEADGDPHRLSAAMPCPACLGPAAVALPAPAIGLAPPVLLAQSADPPPPSSPGPAPMPSPSCRPRAPPPTS